MRLKVMRDRGGPLAAASGRASPTALTRSWTQPRKKKKRRPAPGLELQIGKKPRNPSLVKICEDFSAATSSGFQAPSLRCVARSLNLPRVWTKRARDLLNCCRGSMRPGRPTSKTSSAT